MDENPPPPPAPQANEDETRAWEVELLVSGATVFGLLQLPSKLDAAYYDTLYRSPTTLSTALLMIPWIYLKTSLLVLIVTFIAHLILRGYWIALVGLNSVYPGGVHWDHFGMGPNQRAVVDRAPAFVEHIAAANRRASFVFAVGFALSSTLLIPTVVMAVGVGLIFLLRATGMSDRALVRMFAGGLVALSLPVGVAVLLDRLRLRWLQPDRRGGRLLQRIFAAYASMGMMRGAQPLMDLFRSRAGRRRHALAVTMLSVMTFGVVVLSMLSESGTELFRFAGEPPDAPTAADNLYVEHYGSLRGAELHTGAPHPFIPDRIVSGSYLPLFIPYRRARVEPALRTRCPDAVKRAETGSARAALDCLAQLLDVRIDGAAVAASLDGADDPVTNTRGVIAMLDIGQLTAGRHELTLHQLPEPEAAKPAPPPDERILFWIERAR